MFLQNDSPLSIFELSSSARIHLIPMMLCLNKRFRVGKKLLPNLNHIAGGRRMVSGGPVSSFSNVSK